MYHPIPPGTRDVLPDEMLELRRIENALLEVFAEHSYHEVGTPTLEYAGLLELGDRRSADAAYRFFDERGELLALRTDMTIPIARLAADRLGELEPPHRLCYVANAYRAVTPKRGRRREFGQAGIELIGGGGAPATAEVVEVLSRALDAVGLSSAVIGLGNAGLWPGLLADVGASQGTRDRSSERLVSHDLVGVETILREAPELEDAHADALLEVIGMRGGAEVLDRGSALGGDRFGAALRRLGATFAALQERGIGHRVQLDLGMLRDLGYYSGTTIEVYDPTVGEIIGGGGRYDDLMSKFGLDLPAAGFTLYLERIHEAQIKQGLSGA
ncbi:MAG: ATP phosphoribosyltransferase regulatory subunit [Solirubrobacterales bacterium]|nr:ATP phosphoribosyltransferase regulatory subunit [Solirubrobacterales bacterium]